MELPKTLDRDQGAIGKDNVESRLFPPGVTGDVPSLPFYTNKDHSNIPSEPEVVAKFST